MIFRKTEILPAMIKNKGSDMANRLKITLKKSPNGRIPKQKRNLDALGLRKTNRTVCVPDNPQMQGMVKKISHMVLVERVEGKDA